MVRPLMRNTIEITLSNEELQKKSDRLIDLGMTAKMRGIIKKTKNSHIGKYRMVLEGTIDFEKFGYPFLDKTGES